MTIEKPLRAPERELQPPLGQVDATVATLVAIQKQLEQQTIVLQTISQELLMLRESQNRYQVTLAKLDRQMRWAWWAKLIRTTILVVFWLGVVGMIAYYWTDLSSLWNEVARYIL